MRHICPRAACDETHGIVERDSLERRVPGGPLTSIPLRAPSHTMLVSVKDNGAWAPALPANRVSGLRGTRSPPESARW